MKQFSAGLILIILFSLLSMTSYSQQPVKNYDAQWKKIEDLVKKNLPQSALTEVKNLYAVAKKDKQDAQVIKSLVYVNMLQSEKRENNEIASIAEIEKELTDSKEPVSSILNNLLAGSYWNYYQQHRYELYSRTETTGFKKEDIATWTAEDLHRKISELYLRCLKEEKILQQVSLSSFDAIIMKGNMRHLRPSLYDLLANEAIDYFKSDERDINKPAYAFEIDQLSAFDPAADFITRKFATSDSLSLQHKALLIYQQLIRFHLHDTRPDALIDIDLQRLDFVRDKSVHPDKQDLYLAALTHIANQYGDLPAAAQAWYKIAVIYENFASSYQAYGDSTHRLDRLKAKEICTRILAQKDSSEGRINCYNLLARMSTRSLQFSVEQVNLPAQPFRLSVEYRNIHELSLRVIKVDDKLKNELENRYDDKYWNSILAAPVLKTWRQVLPATNDLQSHRVEIKVDALPVGNYLIAAADGNDWANKKTLVGARLVNISAISYVNNDNDYFVLDRDNGQPLVKAAVQVWEQNYDYKLSKYIREKTGDYTTDANGFFRLIQKTEKGAGYHSFNYQLDITFKNDRLSPGDWLQDYYFFRDENEQPAITTSLFLFTDRSLYRPGQTLFFKGIAVQRQRNEKSSVPDVYFNTIYLQDVNGQQIDSLLVKANDFGSFSGKFQLPTNGLNGTFSLQTKLNDGNAYLHVEEYKRPKFSVEYEALKGTYRVNDSIQLTGVAKAYAGNAIDDATVQYRVVRQPRFLYPWLTRKWWLPPSEPMEITHGTAKSDKDGKFVIAFIAIPDLKIDKKLEPVFNYTVYADVTDINGETRSGEQSVSVSYKSLLLKTTVPSTLPVDSLNHISVRTENMNGEFVPATVTLRVRPLMPENRLIRNRYWERPDQFILNKEEYIRSFPNDEYDNESDFKTWAKGDVVFTRTDSSRTNSRFDIATTNLKSGFYELELTTTDKNGEPVRDMQYTQLYDAKSDQLGNTQYLWSEGSKPIEPGENTTVQLGSSASKLFVIQGIDRNREQIKSAIRKTGADYSFLTLDNGKRSIEFGTTEEDRGGYGVSWVFIKNNRVYQCNDLITVPWTNKELNIEYATYRDKTLPGSEEKWKLRITGYKNEKVAAEMLASMYDASLDQFYPHNWYRPAIWLDYSGSFTWKGSTNFSSQQSNARPYSEYTAKDLEKAYDELIWFGRNNAVSMQYKAYSRATPALPMTAIRGEGNAITDVLKKMPGIQVDKDGSTKERLSDNEIATDSMVMNVAKQEQDGTTQIRRNFNETAFFFPDLHTDSSGAIEFSFTLPDALTKWKFQTLAHTKDLAFGYSSKEIVTQKQLMLQPNPTRFLREGDRMEFSAKVVNMTDKEFTGTAEFQLFDAETNEPVDGAFKNAVANQYFTVAAGQSEAIRFPIEVPYHFNKALTWRIVAKAGDFSDGEENSLPVLTNRTLVTETLPINMKGTGTKDFRLDKLINSEGSETIQHHALTVEYTSNPAWYAIQALPYLMEYPYECAEQIWNRYYANSLASFVANTSPRIKQVFEQWKNVDTAALLSALQKNSELKAILLEETPWVLQAKSEAEQKRNIGLLFDMVRMNDQLGGSFEKLKQLQSSNGGFVWFTGGPDDRYITQYIVTGIGHLKKLNGIAAGQQAKLNSILDAAIPYLDQKIKEDYDDLVKHKTDLKKYMPGYEAIQYLYMRSFFPERKLVSASLTAYNYFKSRLPLAWTQANKYMQGMIALTLYRSGDTKTPAAILKSLKETSITNEELGMYWKNASQTWWWYEAPIERQALLIEAFQEIAKDTKAVDNLRTWLLKNKQTNKWESTKATAEACYALLLQGTNWLVNEPTVQIKLGSTVIGSATNKEEAGTGYFKQTIDGEKVRPSMGTMSVTVNNPANTAPSQQATSWGAVYWQYFEDLDKITTASTPLQLIKKLFVETNSDRGPVLKPVNDGDVLKVGDKVKVRVELRVDRDMEYVHMKDMRAASLEPVNVLSGYAWQGGLGYYQSTRDASTDFFFNQLRKGTYVFEYTLFAGQAGNFSNGITSIQCMYAPEFTAHSEGIRVNVE